MIRNHFKTISIILSFFLLGLIAIQAYWINSTFHLKQQELNNTIKERMNAIAKQLEDEAYCFTFKSKSYIKPGEGIYVIKQPWANSQFIQTPDTLELFNAFFMADDTLFFNDKNVMFQNPATVDIDLKFEYKFADSLRLKSDTLFNPDVKGFTLSNYQDKLSDKRNIADIIAIDELDSMMKNELLRNNLSGEFDMGIAQKNQHAFVYLKARSDTLTLMKSPLKVPILEQRKPREHYFLMIHIHDPFTTILRSIWIMILSSVIIVVTVIGAFAYFINTILKQKKLSQMKNDFINNMTHEFKTPITNISLALENLWENGAHTERYLQIIGAENSQMRENVERILQLATLENKEIDLIREEIDLHELIKRVSRSFGLYIQSLKGSIVFEFHATVHHILADETHLINVLYNLIDNAIKYRQSCPHILIKTESVDNYTRISITDNGIGMSEEIQKHIFDPFYRASTGNIHNVKGFGLGLNYVKDILLLHKGKIEVSSEPGKGSTFSIFLPL